MTTAVLSAAMMSAQRSDGATSSRGCGARPSTSRRARTVTDVEPKCPITARPTIPVAPTISASGMGQRGGHRIAAEDAGVAIDGEAIGHARDIIADMPVCRAYFARQARRPVVAHQAGIGGIGGEEIGRAHV